MANNSDLMIKLGADASSITKTLTKLNGDLRAATSDVRNFNSAFKLNGDTTNAQNALSRLGDSMTILKNKKIELQKQLDNMDARGIDQSSSAYQRAQRSLAGMDSQIANTSAKIDAMKSATTGVGSSFERAKSDVSSFSANANGAFSKMKASSEGFTDTFSSKIRSMTSALIGLQAAQKIFSSVTAGVTSGISRYDAIKAYTPMMQQLGYTNKDATNSMKILQNGVQGLPTSLDGITNAAKRFAPIMGNATDAAKAAVAVNDALAVSSANSTVDMERGQQQYIQMLEMGKYGGQEWRTLEQTMPTALRKIATSFGLSGADAVRKLGEEMKSGKITMAQFNERIMQMDQGTKGFAQMSRTATGGIGTAWQNVKNAISAGWASLFGEIDKGLQANHLGTISSSVNNLKGVVQKAFSVMGLAVTPIITAFIKFKDTVGAQLIGNIKQFWAQMNQKSGAGQSPIEKLFKGISQAGEAFEQVSAAIIGAVLTVTKALMSPGADGESPLQSIISGVKDGLKASAPVIISVAAAFGEFIKTLNQTGLLKPLIALLTTSIALKAAMGPMKAVMSPFTAALGLPISGVKRLKSAMDTTSDALSGLKRMFVGSKFTSPDTGQVTRSASTVSQTFTKMKNAATPAFTAMKGGFGKVGGSISTFAGLVKGGAISAIGSLTSAFTTGLAAIQPFFAMLGANPFVLIIAGIVALVTALVLFFTKTKTGRKLWKEFCDLIGSAIDGAVKLAKSVFNGFVKFFKNPVASISKMWSGLWNGFTKSFSNVFGNLGKTFSKLWNVFVKVFKKELNDSGKFWGGLWNGLINTFKKIFGSIGKVFGVVWNVFVKLFKWYLNLVLTPWRILWNTVSGVIKGAWNFITKIGSWIGNAIGGVFKGIGKIWDSITHVDLGKAGQAIINGFVNGLKWAWEEGKKFIHGIAKWIGEHKGPIEYDRVLLTPHGNAVMAGFNDGLINGFGKVQTNVSGMAGNLSNTFNAAMAGNDWTARGAEITHGLNNGLSNGMNSTLQSVSEAGKHLNDATSAAFGNVGAGLTANLGDNLNAAVAKQDIRATLNMTPEVNVNVDTNHISNALDTHVNTLVNRTLRRNRLIN